MWHIESSVRTFGPNAILPAGGHLPGTPDNAHARAGFCAIGVYT
jgi:hypothetical protein